MKMKKLGMELDRLVVESFATGAPSADGRGTVQGRELGAIVQGSWLWPDCGSWYCPDTR